MSITTSITHFALLDNATLYDIMALREEVFNLEQKCAEPDFDGLDKKAFHVQCNDGKKIVGVARILPPNIYYKGAVSFGRLAVNEIYRGKKYGKLLTETMLNYIDRHYPDYPIEISAQLYLESFYKNFGFKAYSEVYEEAGIQHIRMKRDKNQKRLTSLDVHK